MNANSTFVAVHEPEVGSIRFWEFEGSGKTRLWGAMIPHINNKSVRILRFSPDDQRLFLTTSFTPTSSTFYVCKPQNGETTIDQSDRIDNFAPRDLAWSWNGKMIYLGGLGGRIVCFNPNTGKIQKAWVAHDRGPIKAVAAYHHKTLFVTGANETVCVWSGSDGKLIRAIKLPNK